MNILVIGDEHTYGYGLPKGKLNYIEHFIRQVDQGGRGVTVETYAHLTIPQLLATLTQLPLSRYDLILLQLDQSVLRPARSVASVAKALRDVPAPISENEKESISVSRPANTIGILQATADVLFSYVRSKQSLVLASLLKKLKPYRHRVLLVAPFPRQERVGQWLQQRSRTIILDEAEEQLFSIFDTESVLRPREEYFLATEPERLNAISHEMLGRSLFDFYLSAPTIVTVQTIKREEE